MALEHVLLVEDDEVTALHLKMALEKLDYKVVAVAMDTLQARNKIKIYEPTLVLLDISLDEKDDGIKVGTFIQQNYAIPFIYLTSQTQQDILEKAKVTKPYGYIVKPFVIESLHATIQMAIAQFENEQEKEQTIVDLEQQTLKLEKLLYATPLKEESKIVFCNDFYLDTNSSDIYFQEHKVKLTQKENAFMALLVANKNKTVNFNQAMTYVWEEEGATENSVRTLVWRLRNKLPVDIIQNVSGMGYILED